MQLDAPVAFDFTLRLRCTRDALTPRSPLLAAALAPDGDTPPKTIAFIDDGVHRAHPGLPDRLAAALPEDITLSRPPIITPGGEQAKNDPAILDVALRHIHDAGLCRRSCVLAIGGGAALDVVGFAAATAHRGVRLVRMPTTTLAQADSGVGVKNGVNRFNKKNYLGVFAPPTAVINDESFLTTLTDADWTSGFSEAVKVALVKDSAFFNEINENADAIRARDLDAATPVIRRSAQLHFEHIALGGDPFELSAARPLDFGHWSAHKLEQMTGYELSHGHAVAIGVAIDAIYSEKTGALESAEPILDCLRRLGFTLTHPALADADTILEGLEEFREHLGGRLTVSMLRAIGEGFDIHEIDENAMREAITALMPDA